MPEKSTKVMMPLNTPSIKPKIIFSILYDEILPSNKNNNKLVNNRKTIKEIVKIRAIEKNMIIVGLIETYFEIKNDKST